MSRVLIRIRGLGVGVLLVAALTVGLVAGSEGPAPQPELSQAADVGQFNPGNIVSDGVFFDGNGMSADDVRRFIELKGMGCTPGSDGAPCLKDFRQDTTTRAADAYCAAYDGVAGESAATIIAKVGQACRVNPRALLVILQKEQGLVTRKGTGLNLTRYQKAMGYACPDTAPCDAQYYGFQNQVYSAARRFQQYAANPSSYGYRAGRTNNILFNPNTACGSSPVYIQNQATAGLYIYTPYQPNAAAMAAGYGEGDGCSAYGNRNFWLYYTDWFGSTQLPGQSAWQPLGMYESAAAQNGDHVQVRGWTVDPDTTAPIAVHVYVDGQNRGSYTADAQRPDVAQALPAWGARHGFDLSILVTPGVHEVCVYAINVGSPAVNPSLGCRTADTRGLPMGNVESAVISEGKGVVTGWVIDPDTTSPIDVHVYVNGAWGASGTANGSRPDVGAAYPGSGSNHGFRITVPLQPGLNQVCVFGINTPGPAVNPQLGCTTLDLKVLPVGFVSAAGGTDSVTVDGWAADPESSAPIDVHVYIDGTIAVMRTADLPRPDVQAAVPGTGPRTGYSIRLPAPAGTHEVCVYAINVGLGGVNPKLACGTVAVGVPPLGHLDEASASGATVRVRGWALDPDVVDPIDVHVYADGRGVPAVVRADASRPDVGAAFPGSGANHGFDATMTLAPGRHSVCAYAINVHGGNGVNPSLGCLIVTVPPNTVPFATVDSVYSMPGIAVVSGWGYDPDVPTTPIGMHFYVDGRFAGALTASQSRPDVAAAIPGAGDAHGYTAYLGVSPGRHTVCVYALDNYTGGYNPLITCYLADVN
jgi:hypothetical protein